MDIKREIVRLQTYQQALEERLSKPVPESHARHPETFKQYLNRELDTTKKKIQALREKA